MLAAALGSEPKPSVYCEKSRGEEGGSRAATRCIMIMQEQACSSGEFYLIQKLVSFLQPKSFFSLPLCVFFHRTLQMFSCLLRCLLPP